MPRKPRDPAIQCKHFLWRLFQRADVFYADGRSSSVNLGKHSLNTRDRTEALERLSQLDVSKAIETGRAAPPETTTEKSPATDLPLSVGWQMFLDHANRPQVMGGIGHRSSKRYRAVRDKHVAFCTRNNITQWAHVTKHTTEQYGNHLHRADYADRSVYFEVTLIKSVVKWLIEEGLLPQTARFSLRVHRPDGTSRYCFSREEVRKMLEHCRGTPSLTWMVTVIEILIHTGLRIGELAQLRRTDIDLTANTIRIQDDRESGIRRAAGQQRTTKGKRSRMIPIHPSLRATIERLPEHRDGRLVHGARGGIIKPDTVLRTLKDDVLEPLKKHFPAPAGEQGFADGKVHSFRHYFVSEAFRCGAAESDIMSWVGHRDSKIVAIYRHLRSEESQRKMGQIDFT